MLSLALSEGVQHGEATCVKSRPRYNDTASSVHSKTCFSWSLINWIQHITPFSVAALMNTQCANRFLPPLTCLRVHWWAWPLWNLDHEPNNALSFRFLPGINKPAASSPRPFKRILLHKCSSLWTRVIFMILFSLLFLLFNFQENYFSTLWKWQGFHCTTVTLQLLFSFITFKNGKWTSLFFLNNPALL